jgi:integron integrase
MESYVALEECPRGSFSHLREIGPTGAPRPRLLDRVRDAIRARHYSRRTEKAYVHWIKRYIFFHGKHHPAEMGAPEVTKFLTSLAVDGRVAASTQNQALSALLFLYRDVLTVDLPWLDGVVRAKRPERLPVVLTRQEVRAVLQQLTGVPRLMAYLLYGAGLRVLECCRLRVQDLDFASNQITVRGGKGDKDRVTMLPAAVKGDLARHLTFVRAQHEDDLARSTGWELPTALLRKYPNAGREWVWQWVFPATSLYRDARPASSDGTTCTSPSCSGPSRTLRAGPGSRSALPLTRSGTRSPPTCSKTATTSARCRNCSGIAT